VADQAQSFTVMESSIKLSAYLYL